MARKKLKPGHNPEFYKCANPACPRSTPLSLKNYSSDLRSDVEPQRVHYVWEPMMGGFTILCSACAHYTVVSRYERQQK